MHVGAPALSHRPSRFAATASAPPIQVARQLERAPSPAKQPAFEQASTARRLLHAWKDAQYARAGDQELAPALDTLWLYHLDQGFFGKRFEGMRVERDLGGDHDVEMTLAPNRKDGFEEGDGCPFCRTKDGARRGVSWREWNVVVNAYPYAGVHSRHMVLASSGHRPQSFDAEMLHDMADAQRALTRHRGMPVTMHFNGLAGNSEEHLHWQASHERMPLERWLEEGTVALEVMRRTPDGTVSSWNREPFSGLLLAGTASFVARWAARIVGRLETDPLTQGRYNLLMLPLEGEHIRLVLVPRRALDAEAAPKMGGSWAVCGREVRYEPSLPEGAVEQLLDAVRAHVVKPAELEWLAPLLKKPDGGVLFSRLP